MQLRQQIEAHASLCAEGEVQLSASFGITSVDSASERILEGLNGALYRTKKAGGNRIVIADPVT